MIPKPSMKTTKTTPIISFFERDFFPGIVAYHFDEKKLNVDSTLYTNIVYWATQNSDPS